MSFSLSGLPPLEISCKQNHIIHSLCVWLISLSIVFLRLTPVACNSGLRLLIAESWSIGYICHSLLIHSLDDGHLDSFQCGAVMNYSVVNLPAQAFVWTCVFLARF